MHSLRTVVAAALIGGTVVALPLSQAAAAPTETTRAGVTSVRLAPDFLKALQSLGVAPTALAPGKLRSGRGGVHASFRITTGAVDLGAIKGEIAHEGGLALTKGGTRVELSSFLIDLVSGPPVLTGLVVANDSLVGRLPLFDLQLTSAPGGNEDFLRVDGVVVRLSNEAAGALNAVFGVSAFTEGFLIGTATVRAVLEFEH